ncbi:MAG: monovalent cation/H+ antiporter subunit D [Burkholderiaceae bacterium]|jgi:multicomponent K+:H+ antiporter subunit D|nr:monovalent cation/H+ antiporter subunit D [Burkholderiaceae bacterium]
MTTRLIESLMPHLMMAPILAPLVSSAVMLLLGDSRRPLKRALNALSCLLGLAVALALLMWTVQSGQPQTLGVYLPGNWSMPYGIVLVLDPLAALMLVLTALLGVAGMSYASARWDRAGVHFHSLFQMQLMGLNGAFLTADLFNLFVFFEIMLCASYGLLLHGSGRARVLSGLHYIAINLLASTLFLIGLAILYGVTGTLNMADMALMVPAIGEADRGLLHAGAAILAIAFLVKAGSWPVNFWLAPAYASASAPVAALFAVMTKLGVYAVLRLWTLLFAPDAGISAQFGAAALLWLGLLTLGVGAICVLATQNLNRMAASCVIVSSGTVLAAIGFGQSAITAGALYYAVGSTLAVSALFLVIEMIERSRETEESALYVSEVEPEQAFAFPVDLMPPPDINLDENEGPLIGHAIPAAMAFLGLAFAACTLTMAGLPPFSGFVGKVAMLGALLNIGAASGAPDSATAVPTAAWVLMALLIISGLLTTLAFSRAGLRYFWAPRGRPTPTLRVVETVPVAALLLMIALLVWQAEPALAFARVAANGLHNPANYINHVVAAQPRPAPAHKTATPP